MEQIRQIALKSFGEIIPELSKKPKIILDIRSKENEIAKSSDKQEQYLQKMDALKVANGNKNQI